MTTMLKNVIIVDGSGWIPFWGDIVLEGDKVAILRSGENTLFNEEKTFDKVINYDRKAYVIPGVYDDMTKEKYEEELQSILADLQSGLKIEKAVRKLTGYGVGQREFTKEGVVANIAVLDKPATKIITAYAAGKEL
ncbi:MAG: hypothetical protein IJ720_01955 [Clostridia bacterium]|nr:hypothetical protein [Clostridia bacterium]MBQ8469438.1 hypothetical protein [Clostridia bacterium]MBR1704111.1 hypothetical protein [Clostridia bacterium]